MKNHPLFAEPIAAARRRTADANGKRLHIHRADYEGRAALLTRLVGQHNLVQQKREFVRLINKGIPQNEAALTAQSAPGQLVLEDCLAALRRDIKKYYGFSNKPAGYFK